jgi:hypothetical protein
MIFGITADVHAEADNPTNVERFAKALRFFAAEKADAVFSAGDFTLIGRDTEYEAYCRVLKENAASPVYHLMGNHELDTAAIMYQRLGQRPNSHEIIGGYHCIMASPGFGPLTIHDETSCTGARHGWKDYQYVRSWLEKQLAIAAHDAPRKPIFVFIHHPLKFTIYDSHECHSIGLCSGRGKTFTSIFDDYPQALVFSGHIHSVNNHPKSIWQQVGGFTAINVPALIDIALATGMISGEAPPDNRNTAQVVLLRVDDDGLVTIRNRDLLADQWIEDQTWRFNAQDREDRPYTDTRAERFDPPSFPPGAAITLSDISETELTASFPQAEVAANAKGDIVSHYRFELLDEAGRLVNRFSAFSWFYRLPRPPFMSHTVSFLEAGAKYTLRVFPLDAFDREGAPLEAHCTAPGVKKPSVPAGEQARKLVRPQPKADILDISCEERGPVDALGHTIDAESRAKVVFDRGLDRFVMSTREASDEIYSVELHREAFEKITGPGTFTLEILVKTELLTTEYVNILGNDDVVMSFKLHSGTAEGSSSVHFRSRHKRNDGSSSYITAVITDGEWHHVAAVYDGQSKFLYVDGEIRAQKRLAAPPAPLPQDASRRFALNGDCNGSGTPREAMNGSLAFARIYSVALSAEEVRLAARRSKGSMKAPD